MKSGARQIIGRTITGMMVIERAGTCGPQSQVFLTFSDGSHFEFYAHNDSICGTNGVVRGPVKIGDGSILFQAGSPPALEKTLPEAPPEAPVSDSLVRTAVNDAYHRCIDTGANC